MLRGILDRPRRAAYIAAHDDAIGSINAPPPPCHHGTGALSRLSRPRAAGFWPRHFDQPSASRIRYE